MFTGIVEDLGEVEAVEPLGDFARIHVRSATVTEDARPGDSIAVNGVCLTVTALLAPGGRPPGDLPLGGAVRPPDPPRGFTADVMGETLARSSLASVAPGTRVNLERSVRMADRLGGHLVQGHVDGTGTLISRHSQEHWEVVRISLPGGLARYVVHKGSIAVDGVSLTVSALSPIRLRSGHDDAASEGPPWFEVSLIPETLKRTTLGFRQPGEVVNLEVDVMAKYVEKLLASGGAQ
jgi:riboflavin synthase